MQKFQPSLTNCQLPERNDQILGILRTRQRNGNTSNVYNDKKPRCGIDNCKIVSGACYLCRLSHIFIRFIATYVLSVFRSICFLSPAVPSIYPSKSGD